MNCDGVIFDLDGTLWDATRALTETWRLALSGQPDIPPPPPRQELKSVMGMTAPQLMAALFPHLSPQRGEVLFEKCCAVENDYLRTHGGDLYPGMEETLSALARRLPLFIVSNCNMEYIPCFLEAHKLGNLFTDWECIGRSGLEKWENICLVAKRNRLSHPIYVGDTAMDQQAAQKAGTPFIHAAYGFGQAPGALSINSIKELPALLDEVAP